MTRILLLGSSSVCMMAYSVSHDKTAITLSLWLLLVWFIINILAKGTSK